LHFYPLLLGGIPAMCALSPSSVFCWPFLAEDTMDIIILHCPVQPSSMSIIWHKFSWQLYWRKVEERFSQVEKGKTMPQSFLCFMCWSCCTRSLKGELGRQNERNVTNRPVVQ
jgi:hypothetical protein